MKFTGKVTHVISGTVYVDKKARVRIKIEGADHGYDELQISNDDLMLDQEVEVEIGNKGVARPFSVIEDDPNVRLMSANVAEAFRMALTGEGKDAS